MAIKSILKWFTQREFIYYLYSVIAINLLIFVLLIFLAVIDLHLFNFVKQFFILDTSNLNTNIFLSSYTHTDPIHLIFNIGSYFCLFLVVFPLVDNKKKINKLMISALFVLPIFISLFLAVFTDVKSGGGLSGIGACMYGYIFFAINYNIENKSTNSLKKYSILMLIIFNLLVADFFTSKHLYSIIFALLIFLFILYRNRELGFEGYRYLKITFTKKDDEKYLTCIMWFFALLFAFMSFQMLSPVFATNLNIEYDAHYIGWIYGLVVSKIILSKN